MTILEPMFPIRPPAFDRIDDVTLDVVRAAAHLGQLAEEARLRIAVAILQEAQEPASADLLPRLELALADARGRLAPSQERGA